MKKWLSLLILVASLEANPWGKDADLCYIRPCQETVSTNPSLSIAISETLIKFHQDVISPADGPRSHFIPSSSQYTLNAIKKYGFFKGVSMGCDRLMRENKEEWVYRKTCGPDGRLMKWDPVP